MTSTAPSRHTPNSVYLLKPSNCTTREDCYKAMADQLWVLMGDDELRRVVAEYVQEKHA
jgi:hypothetical protein